MQKPHLPRRPGFVCAPLPGRGVMPERNGRTERRICKNGSDAGSSGQASCRTDGKLGHQERTESLGSRGLRRHTDAPSPAPGARFPRCAGDRPHAVSHGAIVCAQNFALSTVTHALDPNQKAVMKPPSDVSDAWVRCFVLRGRGGVGFSGGEPCGAAF